MSDNEASSSNAPSRSDEKKGKNSSTESYNKDLEMDNSLDSITLAAMLIDSGNNNFSLST
jgi:hypothetical protein